MCAVKEFEIFHKVVSGFSQRSEEEKKLSVLSSPSLWINQLSDVSTRSQSEDGNKLNICYLCIPNKPLVPNPLFKSLEI